ncbi:MAG: prepilin-type N-terminal cleavage/methylation domain-containing protein [Planctomycetota bacterium]|jgi:prepilin-type N-terminal cleavage/methylation domain-containing protein
MILKQLSRPQRAFSLVELVVVLSVLALLSGIVVPEVFEQLRSSRDSQRLTDARTLRVAIEQYNLDKGCYPPADTSAEHGNWDVSHDGGFIQELVDEGYIDEGLVDPVNNETYHYRYFVYAGGSYGCEGDGAFFVLGIRNFEVIGFDSRNRSFFRCSRRDWSDEFAFVTGGGASWTQR